MSNCVISWLQNIQVDWDKNNDQISDPIINGIIKISQKYILFNKCIQKNIIHLLHNHQQYL